MKLTRAIIMFLFWKTQCQVPTDLKHQKHVYNYYKNNGNNLELCKKSLKHIPPRTVVGEADKFTISLFFPPRIYLSANSSRLLLTEEKLAITQVNRTR